MKKIIISILLSGSLFGVSFEDVGFGSSSEDAKKEALKSLSEQLFVKVESSFSKYADSDGSNYAIQKSLISTNLPLSGVKVKVGMVGVGAFEAKAKLDGEISLPLYLDKLKSLAIDIDKDTAKLAKLSGSEKANMLDNLTVHVSEYEKYRLVATLLGSHDLPMSSISLSSIEAQKQALFQQVDSIELAAKMFAQSLSLKKGYFLPLTPSNSEIATPFGSIMADLLTKNFQGVANVAESLHTIKGYYVEQNGFMQMTLVAYETKTGKTIATATLKLLPSAYKSYDYKNKESAFEQALKSGEAINSDLKIAINTNKGSSNLIFKNHETIKISVTLSKPSYFYVVGHTKNDSQTMSYLLPLFPDAIGDERFVMSVTSAQIKRPIILGEYTIEAPFGFESLQVIASSKPITTLPNYKDSNGYAIISTNIIEGLSLTRALKPKTTAKESSAEATLSYVTIDGSI